MGELKVSADELRGAAGSLSRLGNNLPSVGAALGIADLAGSATAGALGESEAAKNHAAGVIRGRYQEMGNLLTTSADTYHDSDTAAAGRLIAMGDLNPSS